jgi:hypothetical protein
MFARDAWDLILGPICTFFFLWGYKQEGWSFMVCFNLVLVPLCWVVSIDTLLRKRKPKKEL